MTGMDAKSDGNVWSLGSFDLVIPNGNEQAFVDMAATLRLKNLIFLSKDLKYRIPKLDLKGVSVRSAIFLSATNDFSRAKKLFDYIVCSAERKYFELRPDFIWGVEYSDRKDGLHYRSTMLNQVHAKLAAANNIVLILDFGALLSSSDPSVVLGRMQQNASLIKKYGLKFVVFSMSMTPFDMRSRFMLNSLSKTLKL